MTTAFSAKLTFFTAGIVGEQTKVTAMTESCMETRHQNMASNIFVAVGNTIASTVRHLKREAEITRTQRLMESLNDDVLRDIGVHRSEIYSATR
jgi:uncharacterized protein YjiS (DUF1127 family)